MENDGNISVIILDDNNISTNKIDNVKVIRIKDKNYNLMLMKDYWPLIGEINGSISFEADETKTFNNIHGFYVLSRNTFKLIIKDIKGDNIWIKELKYCFYYFYILVVFLCLCLFCFILLLANIIKI